MDFSEGRHRAFGDSCFPKRAPEWSERATLWNEVEASREARSDAQVAREIESATARSSSRGREIELSREFVMSNSSTRRIVDDLTSIERRARTASHESYLHALLSMREIVVDGFGKKRTDWKEPKLSSKWRERWTLLSNKYLLAAGRNQLIRAGADAVRGRALEPFSKRRTRDAGRRMTKSRGATASGCWANPSWRCGR